MDLTYYNGKYMPKHEVIISPDDRGFLLADGVYEVIRWYGKGFFDMAGHTARLKRSLKEMRIDWPEADQLDTLARDLIYINRLQCETGMMYIQVTRGAASRTHTFPPSNTAPTVYAYAWPFTADKEMRENGIKALMKDDIRWKRCDIKSIALLPNTLVFQEAVEHGMKECIFVRDGKITECSHSNVFFVINGIIRTHPESNFILSGITRNNVIRMAKDEGLTVNEEAVFEEEAAIASEAFITNTSSEITPVTEINGHPVGSGKPGEVTRFLQDRFDSRTMCLKRLNS